MKLASWERRGIRAETFSSPEGGFMLSWALTFLVIGLIAGLFGFFGVAGVATQIAWILFVVFIILFLVSLVVGRRGPPL
jgi:uncharacterized membrane protein YtjA (UPF0391 family)